MPVEVYERPKLVGSADDLNHCLTDHSSDMTVTVGGGAKRKSKFYSQDENFNIGLVVEAFNIFANNVQGMLDGAPAGRGVMLATAPGYTNRVVRDVDLQKTVGTDINGDKATGIRLVMEITSSGGTRMVSAFPV